MRKTTNFHDCPWEGWPNPIDIKPFFSPTRWASGRNDSWGFRTVGSDGIEGPGDNWPSYASLTMTGVPHFGVTLQYDRWMKSTRQRDSYNSRGDFSKLLKFVRSLHDDQLSLGLFVSFDQAWIGVREFLESDGLLPPGIAWIASRDLPSGAFRLP
jgi:hypothetical protein